MIYVSNMSDAGVHTLFQKDTCKMVKGLMVLMKVWIGTLYKLLVNVDSTQCNIIVALDVDSTSTQLDSSHTESIQTELTRSHQVMA
jgi:hypothetical protein